MQTVTVSRTLAVLVEVRGTGTRHLLPKRYLPVQSVI